ncbi:MAG: L-seryl-tRNA(Sec) selenium transferase [Anaerolineae bacterium]|nr:L-seryl-tRNA(Sec) selenium transferase [Anaerolineae bacterium]
MNVQDELRNLPGVDKLLQSALLQALIATYGRALTVDAARAALDKARQSILSGATCPDQSALCAQAELILQKRVRPTLLPAINATGVVIHTNLGRSPLCQDALAAMVAIGQGYSNLEYDLEAGQRGSRYVHAESLICQLVGAEAALVVNNNAGAVLLALSALAQGKEVIISRGQLVEIGGGFRIPDVMRQSGACLVEVGTTNRTHLRDYEQAIGPDTALLMLAHQSNFRVSGFTAQVTAQDLAGLGHAHELLVFEDLGSGTLLNTEAYGFSHEPTVQEVIAAGVDLVSFSGDKLLGGPQAGILAGKKEVITQLHSYPLTRALRVDKTTLAGLQATLLHYLKGDAEQAVPVWQMISATPESLKRRVQRWRRKLRAQGIEVEVVSGCSAAGGGSLPGETLPTWLLTLAISSPDAISARLRAGEPPVIARIENDLLCLDPRTVLPDQEDLLIRCVITAWRS